VKWGYADEFIALWKANHYPLLKKAQEKGDVISIKAESPRLHAGEDTRWDFRSPLFSERLRSLSMRILRLPIKKNFIRTRLLSSKPSNTGLRSYYLIGMLK